MMFEPFRGARPGAGGFQGFGGGQPGGGFQFDPNDFADIFGDLFGGGGMRGGRARQPMPQRGADVEASITVTLPEAALGAKKTIRVPRTVTCATCNGSGGAPGSQMQTCPLCGGSGRFSPNGGAQFFVSQECPRCHGTGQVVTNPCPTCRGAGRVEEVSTVNVTIPAGADNGTRLRLAGQGAAGERGGPAGDLFIVINVAKHPLFERRDNDLLIEAPVTFADAVLGGSIRIPTLRGKVDLKIPPGTANGATLRMRGQGVPAMKSGKKGDLLVRLAVEMPAKLTPEAKALVMQLREALPPDAHPKRRDFERKGV